MNLHTRLKLLKERVKNLRTYLKTAVFPTRTEARTAFLEVKEGEKNVNTTKTKINLRLFNRAIKHANSEVTYAPRSKRNRSATRPEKADGDE